MIIDIHELKIDPELILNGEQLVTLKKINPFRKTQECTVHVDGQAIKNGDKITVKGHLTTNVMLACDRCLEEFSVPVEAELFQVYSLEGENEDEDILPIFAHEIDLTGPVTEAIILNVPMNWIHDEDCKGLCEVCGVNLNKSSCSCQKNDIDPRLEGLMNIFNTQE